MLGRLLRNKRNVLSQTRFVRCESTHTKVIGIDLGTTNSVVAIMEGGKPKILEDENGFRTTPSVVAFTRNNERLIGTAAKRQAVINPENTLFATKRLIGRRYDDEEIQRDLKNVPFKIVKHDNGDAWVESQGVSYSPSQIGGFILDKMKTIAEAQLQEPIKHAVVTVPAYFNDSQRQATKNAGKIVGLDVLRVINEPTAAALAYGLDKKGEGIIAVFDLGGGTFDISILDIEDGVFEVRSTNGNTSLGGEDFDILLMKYIVDDFKKKTDIDLSGNRSAIQRIREAAEKAKIELSHVKKTTINLPFIHESYHINLELTEDELDEMSLHLINKTIDPVKKALRDAELTKDDIDEVILVGGMTRMPKIKSTVESIFGKKPSTAVNPDEAVALGAAIQGAVLSGAIKDVLLLDVTPLSLGIETYGGIFSPLIPRNTVVPAKKTQIFSTAVDGQTGVEIRVYQGERTLVQDDILIGNFKLSGIPPAPKGTPQIVVSFEIDVDGIIKVTAKDKDSGKDASIQVAASSGLSDTEISRMILESETYKETDSIKRAALENATRADIICTDTETAFEQFDKMIDSEEKRIVLDKVNELRKIITNVRDGAIVEGNLIRDTVNDIQQDSIKIFQKIAAKQRESQSEK